MSARRISKPSPDTFLQVRARIMHRGEIAFGPGKAELLRAIQKEGSMAKGAKSIGMSYMRAWTLVKVMNQSFCQSLVEVERGGVAGGSAKLTATGQEILDLYDHLIEESKKASLMTWSKLKRQLKQ